jgi:glycosyltransferase involved in cell wall biosynthesis
VGLAVRLLHVVPGIEVAAGGLGLAALRYAESLARQGAQVTLLTASEANTLLLKRSAGLQGFDLVNVEPGGNVVGRTIREYQSIAALCRRTRFDVVHLHGAWLPIFSAAGLAARRLGIPYVISPHGTFEPWAIGHKGLKKRLALRTYQGALNKGAAMFFATAEQEIASIRALGLSQPVHLNPNGVDLTEIPQRNGPSRHALILFLSRIHPKKGLVDLVKAWAQVRAAGWRIVIAGPDVDGHQREVEAVIASHGLERDFEFVGLVDGAEKAECFSKAALFVLPTYSENFGIAVAEALAYELPVITTTGAPWELLKSRRCGWWVEPGVETIAAALRSATSLSPDELHGMGKLGRRLVAEKFSWESIAGEALDAYACLGTSRKPA